MAVMAPSAEELASEAAGPAPTVAAVREERRPAPVLPVWLRTQSINVNRHAAALRPFQIDEFGRGVAAPTVGHIRAANALLVALRRRLLQCTGKVAETVEAAHSGADAALLGRLVLQKERAHDWVRAVEQVWDFYFELFGQRQSRFGEWLVSCDWIALDCYQHAYLGLGVARSIPAPPPFSYMRTGFSPATFRRSIPLRRLGLQFNPFPLIQLPYHRLVNPWTLGAILHEISHNLQNDLGLAKALPRAIGQRLLCAKAGRNVARTWVRWNREAFADLCGLLLGGPGVVSSLMDVIGRSLETVLTYSPTGPHPTPYLRLLLSTELLRRMGFAEKADRFARAWRRIYPDPRAGTIPRDLLGTFPEIAAVVVDTVCYQPYPSLGNKRLADVMRFGPKEQRMIEEASGRVAAGIDPGVVPERFLIGAARVALDRKLARPGVIAEHFYRALAKR